VDREDDPPFDDGGSPPGDGEQWFDEDEPASVGDTEVHARPGGDDDGDEDEGDPFAAAHSLTGEHEPSGEEEPEGSPVHESDASSEDAPADAADEEGPPAPEEPSAQDDEPGEIEPLTPENIEQMLHERAPFFLDPDEPPTDSELEAVEGEDTLPPAGGELPGHGTDDLRVRRAQERTKRRREGQRRLLMLIAAIAVLIVVIVIVTSGSSSPPTPSTAGGSEAAHQGKGPSYLSVSTDIAAVPQNILIADRNNSRIISISPKGQVVWTHPVSAPSDAYLSYTGHTAVITQHTKSRIFTLEVDPGIVNYIYGHSDKAGSANNYLHDPQTAQEIAGGDIVIADLGNCRILFVRTNTHIPVKTLGGGALNCVHHVLSPPYYFSKPDAAFPSFAGNGDLVVTELSPAWVDVFDKSLKLLDQVKLSDAGFTAPYDANEYAPGDLIVVDRTTPGVVEEFTATGTPLWRYDITSGAGELDRPTLARVLPDGNVLVADSGNDRVVVIEHDSKKIVWQYGHTHTPGSAPGYLHTPDSVTLVPRSS